MSRAWYSGLPACSIEVQCGGDRHRVVWKRGRVVLVHHDVAAERALIALGGEPRPCLELLAAWRQGVGQSASAAWLRPVVIPSSEEGRAFVLAQLSSAGSFSVSVRTATSGLSGVSPAQHRQLMAQLQEHGRRQHLWQLLAATGLEWRHRAATAAVVRMLRHGDAVAYGSVPEDDVNLAAVLEACTVPAVEDSIRAWRGPRASRQWFFVECHPFEGAGPRSISGSVDDHVGLAAVTLPLTWLVDVWARNAALIDDCFVLAAFRRDGSTLAVEVVRWERDASGRSRPVIASGTAKRTGDHWRLA